MTRDGGGGRDHDALTGLGHMLSAGNSLVVEMLSRHIVVLWAYAVYSGALKSFF